MEQIRFGLESKVDVLIYTNPQFNPAQMREIELGLESDVDVSIYADPKFDCDQMEQIRLKLKKKNATNPADGKSTDTDSMSLF